MRSTISGRRAPDVLLADGGDHSYWQRPEATGCGEPRCSRSDSGRALAVVRESGAGRDRGDLDGRVRRARPRATRPAPLLCGGCPFCGLSGFRGADTGGREHSTTPRTSPVTTCLRSRARRAVYSAPVWIDVAATTRSSGRIVALARELRAHGTHVQLGASRRWARRLVRTDGASTSASTRAPAAEPIAFPAVHELRPGLWHWEAPHPEVAVDRALE